MNKFLALLTALLLQGSLFSEQVIKIGELTPAMLEPIKEGEASDLAIEFTAGTLLPMHFFLTGDMVELQQTETCSPLLEIKRTFYAKPAGNDLLFSLDLNQWGPFQEIFTGFFGFSFGPDRLGAELKVLGEMNAR